jgi:hypothetical protein
MRHTTPLLSTFLLVALLGGSAAAPNPPIAAGRSPVRSGNVDVAVCLDPSPCTTTGKLPMVGGPAQQDVALSVNAAADQHPISPSIYGMNSYGLDTGAFEALASELRLPLQRWGGNITTRYNWQNDLANHGSDWFFENIPEDNPNPAAGNAADHFVARGLSLGTDSLITIPLIGYVAKDRSTPNGGYDCGFSVIKYNYTPAPLYPGGPATDPDNPASAHCGTGKRIDGTFVTNNDPADTSIVVDHTFMQDWVRHLVARFGTATNGGVKFYGLDNEPGLWHETHRDVHPQHASYDELRDLAYQYGAAIKAVDPSASILGPVQDGWTRYFYAAYGDYPDPIAQQDRDNHGGTPFVEWYLQQLRAYEQQHGTRILDYLDLHYYPQAPGVTLSPAGDAATQALRLRSTRSLWDPTYIDESWIRDTETGNIAVQLIPRMRAWVNANYPGTRLSISEYNWGALDHINGALAQADVLGVFGREGLDMAMLWAPPQPDWPGAFAFRMYRNYDGLGGMFGETSVHATSADQGQVAIYAARRSNDGALTLMIINKTGSAQHASITLAGFTPTGNAAIYRYSAANLGAIVREPDQPVQADGLRITLPAESITLAVIPGAGSFGSSPVFLPFIQR